MKNNNTKKRMFFFQISLFIVLFLTLVSAKSQKRINFHGSLSLQALFNPQADLSGGIIGSVNQGGDIQIEVYRKDTQQANGLGTMLYLIKLQTTSTTFAGDPFTYSMEHSMKVPNHSAHAWLDYYPVPWVSNDIKASAFALDRKRYDNTSKTGIYDFLSTPIPVMISVFINNATFQKAKIPGIGILDQRGGNTLFDPAHFCHDLDNAGNPICQIWTKVKQPNIHAPTDLIIAVHRGVWGDNLGDAAPENSAAAFADASKYSSVMESDVMMTKDKHLIITHDYYLRRLSNSTLPQNAYTYNKDWDILQNLKLRKRNCNVSNYKYMDMGNLIDAMITNNIVLTIDIKNLVSKSEKGKCVEKCDYDATTSEGRAKQKESWLEIFKACFEVVKQKNAYQYVAFKTPYRIADLRKAVPDRELAKVLFMPIPHHGDFLDYVDDWIDNAGARMMAIETNFFTADDKYLKPIIRDDRTYRNLLHYVYDRTGLRAGTFTEEPVGPPGVCNRWGAWKIKDMASDYRGDHLQLMSVPYGRIMVLTSDRPDVWLQVEALYKNP